MKKPSNGLSTAGMVLGIVALCLCWIPFINFVLSVLAIVFGAITRNRKRGIPGMVMGIIALALTLIPIIIVSI